MGGGNSDLDLGVTVFCCLTQPTWPAPPLSACLGATSLWQTSPGFPIVGPQLLHASSGMAILANGLDRVC